jgi:kynurenine formamidase
MHGRKVAVWARDAFCAPAVLVVLAVVGSPVQGEQGDWYPSEWGPQDERGAANRLTPEKVLAAARLIEEGRVYQLGRVYEAGMPFFGKRAFEMRVLKVGPFAANELRAHEGYFTGELDQVGTQFDALGHIGIGDRFFNGHHIADLGDQHGLSHLGVERVGAIVTRGVLIDVAGYKQTAMLEPGYEISAADLQGALERQGSEIGEGDVVLIHTGWGTVWESDGAKYYGAGPGIGLEAARFLVEKKIVMVGSDNAGVEVVPNPDPSLAFPVHQLLLTQNGIYLLESIITEELARDRAYDFAFVFAPLRLKGASGSPGNPVAIR